MTRQKKIGSIFLFIPIPLLVVVLALYAIASFYLSVTGFGVSVFNVVRIVLQILGIVAILGVIVGLPLGIYFLAKKDDQLIKSLEHHPRYMKLKGNELHTVSRFSFSAFFSPFVWALFNKLYLQEVFLLIPFYNIYIWFKLSVFGRKMVWERNNWSLERFKKRQMISMIAVIVSFVLPIFLLPFLAALGQFAVGLYINSTIQTSGDAVEEAIEEVAEETLEEDVPIIEPNEGNIDEELSVEEILELRAWAQQIADEQSGVNFHATLSFMIQSSGCLAIEDQDGDLIPSGVEVQIGTDDENTDSDGDGYDDLTEYLAGYNPGESTLGDHDEDGVWDGSERYLYGTSLFDNDSDNDGMTDREEIDAGMNPDGEGELGDLRAMFEQDRAVYDKYCSE